MIGASTLAASLADRVSLLLILVCVSVILLLCVPLVLGATKRKQPVPQMR